jgi:hypothetical protein
MKDLASQLLLTAFNSSSISIFCWFFRRRVFSNANVIFRMEFRSLLDKVLMSVFVLFGLGSIAKTRSRRAPVPGRYQLAVVLDCLSGWRRQCS